MTAWGTPISFTPVNNPATPAAATPGSSAQTPSSQHSAVEHEQAPARTGNYQVSRSPGCDESAAVPRGAAAASMPAETGAAPKSTPTHPKQCAAATMQTDAGPAGPAAPASARAQPRTPKTASAATSTAPSSPTTSDNSPPATKSTKKAGKAPAAAPVTAIPAAASTPAAEKKAKRASRPAYTSEEDDFIRFARDDLSHNWHDATLLFNQHFNGGDDVRKIPGLQSRYYRLLDDKVRSRKDLKGENYGRPELGILETTNRRYYWMEGAYTPEERKALEEEVRRRAKRGPKELVAGDRDGSDEEGYEEDEEIDDLADFDESSEDDGSDEDMDAPVLKAAEGGAESSSSSSSSSSPLSSIDSSVNDNGKRSNADAPAYSCSPPEHAHQAKPAIRNAHDSGLSSPEPDTAVRPTKRVKTHPEVRPSSSEEEDSSPVLPPTSGSVSVSALLKATSGNERARNHVIMEAELLRGIRRAHTHTPLNGRVRVRREIRRRSHATDKMDNGDGDGYGLDETGRRKEPMEANVPRRPLSVLN